MVRLVSLGSVDGEDIWGQLRRTGGNVMGNEGTAGGMNAPEVVVL